MRSVVAGELSANPAAMTWNYLHEIRYARQRERGVFDHRYIEVVEDMGFCMENRRAKINEWLAYYACRCAEDYLWRMRAEAGVWQVRVYRVDETKTHLVTTRFSYSPKKARPV